MKQTEKQSFLTSEQRRQILALEKDLGVELMVSPVYRPARLSAEQSERLQSLETELSVRLVACEPAAARPRRRGR